MIEPVQGQKIKNKTRSTLDDIETLQTGGPDNNRERSNGDNHRHQESKRRPRLI